MANLLEDTERLIVKQKFEPLEAMANAAANALDMDALGSLGEVANKYSKQNETFIQRIFYLIC